VKDYHINIFFSEEDEGYIADVPDLEACSAFGATAEQALAEVERAKSAWIAAARDAGKEPLGISRRRGAAASQTSPLTAIRNVAAPRLNSGVASQLRTDAPARRTWRYSTIN